MKKYIVSLCTLVVVSCILFASSKELTLFNGDREFATINLDAIQSISYSGEGEGYDKMNVLFKDRTFASFNMNQFTRMELGEVGALYSITEEYDDHCEVIVLDHYYNEGTEYADHYHQSVAGVPVHYYYTVEVGYDAEISIIGDKSGYNYRTDPNFEFEDDYTGTGSIIKSVAFIMPKEPITVKGVSIEHDYYVGKEFIGTYPYGFWINESIENHTLATSDPMMSVELRASGAFYVTSSDSNNYDFKGAFTYDEKTNSFNYIPENCKTYGLEGKIISEDFVLGTVKNIVVDMPENTHFYWLSKKPVNFVRATGETRDACYILEVGSGSNKDYYYLNTHTRTLSEAKAEFSRGSTLGDVSTAILTVEKDPYAIKYTLDKKGGKPTVEYARSERGSYTGSDDVLWLDGFGEAKFGSVAGTYTISGILVTFVPKSGETMMFYIDESSKTYEKVLNNESWNGPLFFSTANAGGSLNSTAGDSGVVEIWLNHNFSGQEEEGSARLTMRVGSASLADNTVPYTYNASNNTITLSFDYVYYGADWVESNSLVLKVSEDKQSLTFEQGYVSTFGYKGNTWILGDGTVMTAGER